MVDSNKIPLGYKVEVACSYCLAADLGQSVDPTAIAVLEHRKSTLVHWKGKATPHGEEFRVRHLSRLPLGMPYTAQVERIASLLQRSPINNNCDFVIDETGVGRPVGDLFSSIRLKPIRVVITGGEGQRSTGLSRWYVPKSLLISALDARLHTQELKIAPDLAESDVLRDELKDFRRHVNSAGRTSFEARVGKHDDLVLAVALALWNFVGRSRRKPAQFGKAGYTR